MTPTRPLVALGALYVAQGLSFGFFTQALPVLLRERGASLEDIGLSSALMLPWAAKALWAPLVERIGRLRTWALVLSAGMAAAMLAVGAFDPAVSLVPVFVGVLVVNLFAATQDVATDGMAVAELHGRGRGWGNALQVGGYRVGMVVGGGLLLLVYARLGWQLSLTLLGLLAAAFVVPLLLAPALGDEPARAAPSRGFGWDWLLGVGAWRWVAVLVLFKLGDYLATAMVRPWLVDLGWQVEDLGSALGIVGFLAGLVGAGFGGALVGRLDRVVALVLCGLLQSAALVGYAVVAVTGLDGAWIVGAVVAEHLLGGMSTVALFAAMMDACRRDRGATDYAVQAAIVVLASGVAAGLSGFVATRVGYGMTFQIGAALSVLAPAAAAVPAMTVALRRPGLADGRGSA